MKLRMPSLGRTGTDRAAVSEGTEGKPLTSVRISVPEAYVLPASKWRYKAWRLKIQVLSPAKESCFPDAARATYAGHYHANGPRTCEAAVPGQVAAAAFEPQGVAVG
jgi:hypothetical protein